MPKTGLVSRSLPSTRGHGDVQEDEHAEDARSRDPVRRGVDERGRARRGPGRPLVRSSYRGSRQAIARTVNETVSAATAPAIASSGEMGRSLAPPIPWASVIPSESHARSGQLTSSWTMTFSSSCDSTSTTPGSSMVSFRVVVPAP